MTVIEELTVTERNARLLAAAPPGVRWDGGIASRIPGPPVAWQVSGSWEPAPTQHFLNWMGETHELAVLLGSRLDRRITELQRRTQIALADAEYPLAHELHQAATTLVEARARARGR